MAAEDVEQSWTWEGILPAGGMSLLVAKPKVGKTTLAFNLSVAVSRGEDFLNRKTEKGAVVYLALEEKKGEIKKKLTAAGITDEPIRFHFGSAPVDAMSRVEPLIIETKATLLVIDVLQKFCRLRDLNDYAIVTNALEPLMAAARKQGCHILLTHHAGKRPTRRRRHSRVNRTFGWRGYVHSHQKA
jgi:RecA-family ATPase